MSAYRFFNPAPVFLDLLGLQPLAGGFLHFYDLGTTSPRDTWSDSDLSILNSNPVPLDSSGRSNVNIWLDGAYSVTLKSADGTTIWTRDVDAGAGAGQTIPALTSGYFLTNDGTNLLWAAIREVPDPTGSADSVLSTDGSNLIWTPLPEITVPDPDIVVASDSLQVGISTSATKFLIQMGSSSAPASGGKATSASVAFATNFLSAPKVFIQPNNGNAGGVFMRVNATSISTNGFTASFSTLTGGSSADGFATSNINATINFDWLALGNVVVSE